MPEEVIDYIATVITTNIRELDGAITKVVGYASLLKQPITLDLARAALQEPPRPGPAVTVEDILRVVTARYNVRVSDLQSRKRTRSVVLPRQICMYLARSLTTLSLEEIGGYFGGRDHSTVLHAEAKIAASLEKDTALAHALEALKHDLRAPVPGAGPLPVRSRIGNCGCLVGNFLDGDDTSRLVILQTLRRSRQYVIHNTITFIHRRLSS